MYQLSCMEEIGCKILQNAKIPQHIAFIMDGNRRYAKKLKKQPTRGHFHGVVSLKKCLLICSKINIKMASFYCFSIENFKRSEEQINILMQLFIDTLEELSEVSELLKHHEIKVNVVGNRQLVRPDVVEMLDKLEDRTKHYEKMIINFCFAYDSLFEIETSISKIQPSNYSYKNLMNNLSIKDPVDILVRTSNEHRLSNFMLAQCGFAYICILKENWPELSIISFIRIILQYNYKYKEIEKHKKRYQQRIEEGDEVMHDEETKKLL